MSADQAAPPLIVRGTEILSTDSPRVHRQKLARITLDSMVQFVGLLDAHGTVLEINKVALDAVGIQLADVEGVPFWETFWWQVSDEVNRTLRESIRRAKQGEFVRWDAEIYGRAGGKETIIIDASLSPVLDDDGRVVFICAEGRDITEKKAQEREIAQKNIELQGLLERIRELDEIKTQFFANVSHELRTPLALILGPAQRLIDDDGTMDLARRRESAQVVARNARMLLKHVNDLLDMSKLEAGKLKIELRDTDIAGLVRFLASHFGVLAAERAIEYVVVADEPCVAAVDPDKLQRVLMNLLANAFKFTPPGGRIRCTLQPALREFTISVADSGPGVKPELRQAIFERFRQGDGGSNRKAGGTGLGLAIAKEFVEMHKGEIEVLESPLGGACFQITIPRNRVARAHDDVAASTANPTTSTANPTTLDLATLDRTTLDGLLEELRPGSPDRRPAEASRPAIAGRPLVLVVEDNPDMNRFVTQCLARDYEVVSAFDGREGLELALRYHPLLAVSDIMMPHMSGVEMIAEMRRRPELRTLPILLLSAKADEQLMIQLLDEGAHDFIVKPFSEKDLLVRVRNLVQALQARAESTSLREAAENANRAKDEFLAMLAHELRNPLSPIRSGLDLLRLKPESSVETLALMQHQVDHLVRLVDDLLDVSRIVHQKIELRSETVDLRAIVERSVEVVRPAFRQHHHELAVSLPAEPIWLTGDSIRLTQVIENLLLNACKYTPAHGRIDIAAECRNDEAVLRVRDNGIGIEPELLPRVFDLFAQSSRSLDRSQGGLGIGLTLVKTLVQMHGGTVSAQSAGPGSGSLFTIHLPTRSAPESCLPPVAEGASPERRSLRILTVDDNVGAATLLSRLLTKLGNHVVRMAHDGPAALQAAAEFRPEVILLDIGLPGMDGYQIARTLRQDPDYDRVLLVALTGYGQEEDRRKAFEAGFDEHLTKPPSVQSLQALLIHPKLNR